MRHVADDRDIGADHLVDRGRVDIDMRLLRFRREIGDPPGDPVVETGADIDHQVAAMHREVGLVEPVHAEHAEPVPAARRIGAEAHQRRGDGKAGRIGQLAQQPAGIGPGIDHPAAGVENRPLGLFQRLDQRRDHRRIALDLRLIMPGRGLLRLDIGAGGELHVLGNVHQHRAGPAPCGDVERLMYGLGQPVGLLDQPVVLGGGAGDAHRVGLLEGVRADHEGRHLAGQHDERDRIHQRIDHPGHGIGRAGAGGDEHDARLAGRAGIALGHMDGALFVAHQDVTDRVLLENLVVDRQHGAAGIAEHHLDALILQGLHHHLRAGHRPRHVFLHPSVTQQKAPEGRSGAHGVLVRFRLPAHAPRFNHYENERHRPASFCKCGGP